MNKYNAHLCLPLVLALAEGKQLQWKRGSGEWVDTNEPEFLEPLRYRIKPEPREWWILRGLSGQYMDESEARALAEKVGAEAVLVREVLRP